MYVTRLKRSKKFSFMLELPSARLLEECFQATFLTNTDLLELHELRSSRKEFPFRLTLTYNIEYYLIPLWCRIFMILG